MRGADTSERTGQVESFLSTRQARRVTELISAAKATLQDDDGYLSEAPAARKPVSVGRRSSNKLSMLTVLMWISIIITTILILFIFTAPLHIGRYSGDRYSSEIILGVSYIALGISIVAACASLLARNSFLQARSSKK